MCVCMCGLNSTPKASLNCKIFRVIDTEICIAISQYINKENVRLNNNPRLRVSGLRLPGQIYLPVVTIYFPILKFYYLYRI